jgi:hypothetical protein
VRIYEATLSATRDAKYFAGRALARAHGTSTGPAQPVSGQPRRRRRVLTEAAGKASICRRVRTRRHRRIDRCETGPKAPVTPGSNDTRLASADSSRRVREFATGTLHIILRAITAAILSPELRRRTGRKLRPSNQLSRPSLHWNADASFERTLTERLQTVSRKDYTDVGAP